MRGRPVDNRFFKRTSNDNFGTSNLPTYLENPLELASKFLRAPLRNSASHAVCNLLASAPFLSSARRAKFERSARKRDAEWLSRRIESMAENVTVDEGHQSDFDGFRERARRQVLESEWHLASLRPIGAPEIDNLPLISISLVTHNSSAWLPGFFSSLLAQDYPLSKINLFFVDNSSYDDTLERVESFKDTHGNKFSSIWLHRQDNVGFGLGHDYVLRKSNDDFVLISNLDLQFHKSSLIRAVYVAQKDLKEVACWELRQCPYEHPKYYDPVSLETSWTSYACSLLRRSAYLAVGGFEERIFMYGEDVELSYRLRDFGYKLRYLPQATVTHYVDFDKTSLRPHQLSGSVAANVLLRYRYGSPRDKAEGLHLLHQAIELETKKDRKIALNDSLAQIMRDREHFERTKRVPGNAFFPFNGFDYDVTRLGHDISLDNAELRDRPLVSIITRTHGPNVTLLNEAIASVLNQTYPHIEHIIVEDRSSFTHGAASNVRNTYGKDIKYIRSNGIGRSIAGNTGLEAASGEFLMFLDNDDLLFSDHVEILVRTLVENMSAPAAYTLAWELPTHYDQSGRYREDKPNHVASHLSEFSRHRLTKMNFIPIQSVLFRRSLFDDLGGFDPEIDHLEDWNLWVRYSQKGRFHFVRKTTSMYRVPGDPVFRNLRTKAMLQAEAAVRRKNISESEGEQNQ